MSPYAAVILPTHDRSSTLPIALASAQAQSVRDIEILVVLDGAQRACRDIAYAASSADPRIRILDLPKKGPGPHANTHLAVLAARAPRIFYIDDDDLFLPSHVETLGPPLDDADVADTRVASVGRDGALHLGACPNANSAMRRLLAERRHKTLYDTHLAHRASAYERFARWAPPGADGKLPVWDFLEGFAREPECRWRSSPVVTALSLHGGWRRDMSPAVRAQEIALWADEITRDPSLSDALACPNRATHLFRLMCADPPADDLAAWLHAHDAYDDIVRCDAARALDALIREEDVDNRSAVGLIRELSAMGYIGSLDRFIADFFMARLPLEQCERLFALAAGEEGEAQTGALAGYARILARHGKTEAARAAAERALAQGPDPIGQLATLADELAGCAQHRVSEPAV
jgi:glycosyltransferase involved in cell wall biosynthesis